MCVCVLLHIAGLQHRTALLPKSKSQTAFTWVNFSGHLNIYDSHPLFVYSPPSFCSSLWPPPPQSVLRSLLSLSSLPFPALLTPPPPLTHPPVLPCPRPAPIGYHLTWQRVLGSIQWQRHIALLSLYTVSLPWNLHTATFLYNYFLTEVRLYYNIPTGCLLQSRFMTYLLLSLFHSSLALLQHFSAQYRL